MCCFVGGIPYLIFVLFRSLIADTLPGLWQGLCWRKGTFGGFR